MKATDERSKPAAALAMRIDEERNPARRGVATLSSPLLFVSFSSEEQKCSSRYIYAYTATEMSSGSDAL